jgi:prepilin-type N-terminal cleavage/methylation domain-containing protein
VRGALRDQDGFTLPEMMVTITIMLVVVFSLFSIFDTSIRVFGLGNDKVEAVENARLGLERMSRELRGAYPYDRISGQPHLFWGTANPAAAAMPTSTSVTFGNDVNGNRKVDAAEQVTYGLGAGSPAVLLRNGEGMVGSVADADGDGQALTFEYLTAAGGTATSESQVARVRIKLEVVVEGAVSGDPVEQVLTTEVALRNRGE